MKSKALLVAINLDLQTYSPTVYLYFSTDVEHQMYLSRYEGLCITAGTCETGVCHRGETEDSNPQEYDTVT